MKFLTMDFFLSLMITFFVLSILTQILIGVLYQHMIEEAENMQNTTNKLLLQLKQKYINSYTLNDGVTNVPVFVDKFINRLQIGRISLNTLKNCSGQSMLLSVSAAGVGICKGLIEGDAFFALLPYYIISFLGLYFYFSVISIVDIPSRKNMLKTNLVEYLENHLALRLEAATAFAGMEEEEGAELPKSKRSKKQDVRKKPKDLDWVGIEPQSAGAEHTESEKTKEEPIKREKAGQIKSEKAKPYLSEQQEKELEELLRDFLS